MADTCLSCGTKLCPECELCENDECEEFGCDIHSCSKFLNPKYIEELEANQKRRRSKNPSLNLTSDDSFDRQYDISKMESNVDYSIKNDRDDANIRKSGYVRTSDDAFGVDIEDDY